MTPSMPTEHAANDRNLATGSAAHVADVLPPIAALLQIVVGLAVMLGWCTHTPPLLRLGMGARPMHFPAAFAVLCGGLALLSLILDRRRLAPWLTIPVFVIAIAEVLELYAGLPTSLHHLWPTGWAAPERFGISDQMAPDTILSLLLMGAALIASSLPRFEQRGTFVAVCGVLVWALSTSALIGFATGLPPSTAFGRFNGMPLSLATVYFVFGLGMAVRALRKSNLQASARPRCAAILVTSAAVAVTVSFWHGLVAREPGTPWVFNTLFLVGGLLLSSVFGWTVFLWVLTGQRRRTAEDAFREVAAEATRRERAQAEARASELRLRAILEGAGDAIIAVDSDGRVDFVNAAAEAMFGYTRDELHGQPIEILVPERHREKHLAYRREYSRDPKTRAMGLRMDLFGRRKDCTELPVEISLSPVIDGPRTLILTVIRDVSERRAAEHRESTMLRALATIGESATILAHEIKNPLTAVNAALKSLASKLGMEQAEVLGDLVDRMRRVEMMIRRTLSFTKPVDLRRSKVSVADLFKQSLADARPATAAGDISTEISIEPPDMALIVDGQLIREVIVNLVANAAEAARGPSHISLTARAVNGKQAVIEVRDDGPGLPDSMRANPFRPFVTTKKTGSGIGLSICKKMVEEHGGKIVYTDASPHGACWIITLPTSTAPVS